MADGDPPPRIIHVGSNLPLPLKLELKGNIMVNWKSFRQMWDNYKIASQLKNKSKEFRTATLLTCIGQDALEIYDGLSFVDKSQKTDIDVVLQKLEAFCVGTTSEIYERYLFNKRDQAKLGESIDTYVAALRSLSKTCNYGMLTDNLIRDRVVMGILDKGIWKKLLQESKLTLQSCIDICQANETTQEQLQKMKYPADVAHIRDKKNPKPSSSGSTQAPVISCKFCGKKTCLEKGTLSGTGKKMWKVCSEQSFSWLL